MYKANNFVIMTPFSRGVKYLLPYTIEKCTGETNRSALQQSYRQIQWAAWAYSGNQKNKEQHCTAKWDLVLRHDKRIENRERKMQWHPKLEHKDHEQLFRGTWKSIKCCPWRTLNQVRRNDCPICVCTKRKKSWKFRLDFTYLNALPDSNTNTVLIVVESMDRFKDVTIFLPQTEAVTTGL